MKRSRSVVITKKKKKKKGSAMLTFQKRQSHRGKSRSSGIKTEVRYHVCACMCGNPCTDGPIFFFFSDERGHQTTEKIQLLHEKKNGCSNFAPKYIERSLPIYLIFDQRDDHLYFRDNNILNFCASIFQLSIKVLLSPSCPVRKQD